MYRHLIGLSLLFYSFFSLRVHGQDVRSEPMLTPQEQQQDLTLFFEKIEAIHPGLYDFQTAQDWSQFKDSLLHGLQDPVSIHQFYPTLGAVAARIHCGHTVVEPSRDLQLQLRTGGLIPFEPRFTNGNMFVWKNLSPDTALKAGTQILAINGTSVPELITAFSNVIPSNGRGKLPLLGMLETHFDLFYVLLFGKCDQFELRIKKDQGETTTVLDGMTKEEMLAMSELRYGKSRPEPPLSLELSQKLDLGLITLRSLAPIEYGRWNISLQDTLKSFFQRLQRLEIDHLLIDLRNNKGGSRGYTNVLLSYLLDSTFHDHHHVFISQKKPPFDKSNHELRMHLKGKKALMSDGRYQLVNGLLLADVLPSTPHFKGSTFILMDRNTFSAATHLASIARSFKGATLLGEQSAGFENYSNAGFLFQMDLPNSGYVVKVPYFQSWYFPVLRPSKTLLKPDIPIERRLDFSRPSQDYMINEALRELLSTRN